MCGSARAARRRSGTWRRNDVIEPHARWSYNCWMMEPKAIGDLVQLKDDELFGVVAEGMRLVYENAIALAADAEVLAKEERLRGCGVLRIVAQEEAAKSLILLDAVRCERNSEE